MSIKRERKYIMLKLIHSGRTLKEAKAEMKAVAVGLTPEYAKQSDLKDLQSLEGGLYRIRQTRQQAQGLLKGKICAKKDELNKRGTSCKMGFRIQRVDSFRLEARW